MSLQSVLPLAEEEIGNLKQVYAFLYQRFEIESKIIEDLETLLENAPQLPDSKFSWHPAVNQVVEGTRIELEKRRAIHQTVADQIYTFGQHVDQLRKKATKLNLERLNLDKLDKVETAQRIAEDRYGEWKKSSRLPRRPEHASSRIGSLLHCAPAEPPSDSEADEGAAEFLRYLEADLSLRQLTCNINDARSTFTQKLPDRIYDHYTLYQSTVSGLQTSLTSLGNYQRDIATIWNSNGSSLWLLANEIKPLIDSGLHHNEVKIEHDGLSPYLRFSELQYRNAAFQKPNDVTQPILFGRSAQSIYYQTHPSARALPECLLHGVSYLVPPTRNESLYTSDIWSSINAIEQSWTNQEEKDRQIVLKYPSRHRYVLFLVYLQCLPSPLLPMKNDLRDLIYKHEVHADLRARSLWETWSHDPVARSVLSTLLPRLRHPEGRLWSTARPFIPYPRIVYYLSLLTRCMEDDPTLSYLFSMMVDIEPWNTGTETFPVPFMLRQDVETSETEDWEDYVDSASEE